jgi:hypothetical protein
MLMYISMLILCLHVCGASVGQCRSPPSFFISGSFINIKLDNKKSTQMVAQILPW